MFIELLSIRYIQTLNVANKNKIENFNGFLQGVE